MRPLPDILARNLGANLFLTRLFGHGTTTNAMVDVSINAWVNDFAEALAIGERLGDKVVIMGTSTGGALATWAIAQPAFRDRVTAAIFCSPNYGVQAFGSSLLTLPFAREIARLVIGETRSFEPGTDLQRLYWTMTYPVDAILPMAETVKLAVTSAGRTSQDAGAVPHLAGGQGRRSWYHPAHGVALGRCPQAGRNPGRRRSVEACSGRRRHVARHHRAHRKARHRLAARNALTGRLTKF